MKPPVELFGRSGKVQAARRAPTGWRANCRADARADERGAGIIGRWRSAGASGTGGCHDLRDLRARARDGKTSETVNTGDQN